MKSLQIERRIREAIDIESKDFLKEFLTYKPTPLTDEDYLFLSRMKKNRIKCFLNSFFTIFKKK